MSKMLRYATVLAAVCLGAAAPGNARLDPARLAGFTDIYAPKPKTRDYELYMAAYKGEEIRNDIVERRRGDWIKVEAREGKGLNVQYVHVPTGVVIERKDDFLNIRSPESAPTPGIDYASKKTKRSWKAAGQSCRIWEVYRGVDAGYTIFTRFGCITGDGIEVARWTTGRTGGDVGDKTTGYHLVKRKLADADVHPSASAFDISAWLKAQPPLEGQADYEVTLKAEGSADAMTIRRHGGWTFTETVNADGSRDMFSDRDDGVTVSARVSAAGTPLSYTARRGAEPEALPVVRLPLPPQTVLNQTCDWFDAMPYAADAGRHECRTADGVILVVRKVSRGEETTLTATAVNRRPMTRADLLPPDWLLDLKRWGAKG